MIRLALTDLDDTLIPLGSSCASHRAISAIHSVIDAGLHFGPVTGRVPASMDWMFNGDEGCYATGAFVNGQAVYVDGELRRLVTLPGYLLEKVANVLDETCEAYLAVYDLTDPENVAFVTTHPDQLESHPPLGFGHVTRVISHARADSYYKANIHCTCPQGELVDLRERLSKRVRGLGFVFPSLVAPIIDVLPKDWNKGCAVKILAEELGVSLDEIVVFGDSDNDLAMLRSVDNSVAVANASAEVEKAARWHIGPCDDDAVADALLDIAQATRCGGIPAFMAR